MYMRLAGLGDGAEYGACAGGGTVAVSRGSCPPGWAWSEGRTTQGCCYPPPAPVAAPAPSQITVSPVIQTSISPQVSPVFQQAWQPQQAMVAGTSQQNPTSQQVQDAAAADTLRQQEMEKLRLQQQEAREQRDYDLKKLQLEQQANAQTSQREAMADYMAQKKAVYDEQMLAYQKAQQTLQTQQATPMPSQIPAALSPVAPKETATTQSPAPAGNKNLPLLLAGGGVILLIILSAKGKKRAT